MKFDIFQQFAEVDFLCYCMKGLAVLQVAMMYLTKGELYHSSTWKLWYDYAGGFLPMGPVKEACKDPQLIEKARKLCKRRTTGTGEETLANQHLFNVYVHVGLNNQEFKGEFLGFLVSLAPYCIQDSVLFILFMLGNL